MNAHEHSAREQPANAREARAEQYFERDLKGQRDWYSKHASSYKQRSQSLAFRACRKLWRRWHDKLDGVRV
jgi:hypothetical protein